MRDVAMATGAMSVMQKRPMAFSGWAALLSTDAGAGATSLCEP